MNLSNHFFPWAKHAGFRTRISDGRYFSLLPALLCVALLWPFGGGQKIHMIPGSTDPSAQAVIHIRKTDNGNKQLNIQAHSLAQPTALSPSEETYVVWIQRSGHPPMNEGQLKVNNKLNGQLTVETAYKAFNVFITAQKYAQTQSPSGPTILSAQIQG